MMAGEMVLVDTVIWADHIDHADEMLRSLLEDGRVLMHPYVFGELAMGNLKRRANVIRDMQALLRVEVATDEEVLHFIENHALFGRGIRYVDAHLLAAVHLTGEATLWTRDRRLCEAAERLGVDFNSRLT